MELKAWGGSNGNQFGVHFGYDATLDGIIDHFASYFSMKEGACLSIGLDTAWSAVPKGFVLRGAGNYRSRKHNLAGVMVNVQITVKEEATTFRFTRLSGELIHEDTIGNNGYESSETPIP